MWAGIWRQNRFHFLSLHTGELLVFCTGDEVQGEGLGKSVSSTIALVRGDCKFYTGSNCTIIVLSSSKSTYLSSIRHNKPLQSAGASTLLSLKPMRWVLFLSPLTVEKNWGLERLNNLLQFLFISQQQIQHSLPACQMLDSVLCCHWCPSSL